MSMDVTAWIMGDPAVRSVRQPTAQERDKTSRAERFPQGNVKGKGRAISQIGLDVRAMLPGDVMVMPSYSSANGHSGYMVRNYGWTMQVRRVNQPDGSRRVEMRRVR